jgi:hypothetical protein
VRGAENLGAPGFLHADQRTKGDKRHTYSALVESLRGCTAPNYNSVLALSILLAARNVMGCQFSIQKSSHGFQYLNSLNESAFLIECRGMG